MPARRPALAALAAAAAVTSLLLTGCDAIGASALGGTVAPSEPAPQTVPVAHTPSTEPTPAPTPTPTPTRKPKPKPTQTAQPQPEPEPTRDPDAIMAFGDTSEKVRELQVRLTREDVFDHDVTGYFGPVTERAVEQFQRTVDLSVTGWVDAKTWSKLVDRTGRVTRGDLHPQPKGPAYSTLSSRCKVGRVVCIDKSTRSLRWVINGEVQYWLEARFGGSSTPTDEGTFSIQWKDRDHVSSIFESSMPFSLFFSGGQAVHYSANFASVGYDGASHGCVNVRDWGLAERLFNDTRVGDKVIVYWS